VGDVLSERTLLRTFADQTNRVAQGLLGSGVRVAYGRADDGVSGVARSYREARIALALGEHADKTGVYPYDDLRVYAAIQEVAQSPSGQNFAKEVLMPLRHADGQTGDLKMLAMAYIEESGNVNATARRLHLHRNTMLYKLNRVSRALRMDIRKSETQFMIWLACRIETLSEVQADFAEELTLPS
jgi:DNA-binding PucR family transcriptional regulator